MKGILVHYGRLSAASVMFLLVGVVVLSTATRQPCLRACTGAWHTYQAGHMIESEHHEGAVAKSAETGGELAAEIKVSPPRHVHHEEIFPIALLLTFQRNHFRSPPVFL